MAAKKPASKKNEKKPPQAAGKAAQKKKPLAAKGASAKKQPLKSASKTKPSAKAAAKSKAKAPAKSSAKSSAKPAAKSAAKAKASADSAKSSVSVDKKKSFDELQREAADQIVSGDMRSELDVPIDPSVVDDDDDGVDADVAEAEARSMDLDEVAVQVSSEVDVMDDAPADAADMPDAADIEEAIELEGVMPLSSTEFSDDFDGEDVMAGFAGRSVLGAEERNAVIQEVKQRAEKNGGYVTYDELNQIVPATVQDEATTDEYLSILQALGVDVIRPEDVDTYRALKEKRDDGRLSAGRNAEIFEDPIRMYLHQMGQVPLLSREQEVDICMCIEEAEAKLKDMFNRFAFTPVMYLELLDKLEGMQERFDRIVTDRFDDNRDSYMEQLPQFRKLLHDVSKKLAELRKLQASWRRTTPMRSTPPR